MHGGLAEMGETSRRVPWQRRQRLLGATLAYVVIAVIVIAFVGVAWLVFTLIDSL